MVSVDRAIDGASGVPLTGTMGWWWPRHRWCHHRRYVHQGREGGHDTLMVCTTRLSVPMDFESIVIIVVFYDDTWNCTYAQLIDKVYKIVKVDREKYNVKMKYQYIVSYQPCAPQEINSDQDVKKFIHVVKTIMPVTPLYVEIISNVAEVYSADERNNDTYAKFTAGSGTLISQLLVLPQKLEKGKKKKNMLMCPMLRKLNCGKVKSLKVLFGRLKICRKMYHIGKVKHNGKVKSRKHAHLGKHV
ncbi:hypothetical protein FNV43_RR14737 [Rhamnella rubrinervis]|uniref:Uncharacterized protein n=1 Tax=Rhamnella rubrinervis TaxID=2594499 RepID=A0A8K0H3N6_9ROSA|nr:hypothetical protein FNV43_RR14737 [Rhamnella rubrinervis]